MKKICLTLAFLAASLVDAQTQRLDQPPPAPAKALLPPAAAAAAAAMDAVDAEQPRARFHGLLQKHPPAVRRILALDPTLMSSQSYLAFCPDLAAFLAAHPVIARNLSHYVGSGDEPPRGAEERMVELSSDVLAGPPCSPAWAWQRA